MATNSSIVAWETPGQRTPTEYSPGDRKRVGHDLVMKNKQK